MAIKKLAIFLKSIIIYLDVHRHKKPEKKGNIMRTSETLDIKQLCEELNGKSSFEDIFFVKDEMIYYCDITRLWGTCRGNSSVSIERLTLEKAQGLLLKIENSDAA